MTLDPDIPRILSASRRTDIPAFYMDWFMQGIRAGVFNVTNPYNQRVSRVPAIPESVHSIVFWSKDFSRFFDRGYGEALTGMGYNLFFNFTINSESEWLEPKIPPLDQRLETLGRLCRRFGPECINWRFDPVCFFILPGGEPANNLHDFAKIAEAASQMGIRRCITSFMDHYPKIKRRLAALPGFSFRDPPMDQKVRVLERMAERLKPLGISLYTCCEKSVMAALPRDTAIRSSECISGSLLMALFGGHTFLRRDSGQRVKQGCGCTRSWDIGSYREHPCGHNCLFCYASPASQCLVFSQNS